MLAGVGRESPALPGFPRTPAEVVVGQMQLDGGFQVFEFLRESQGEPGEPWLAKSK
jgi:hypothetical protein